LAKYIQGILRMFTFKNVSSWSRIISKQ
jgi:hypothetical protein